MKNKKALIISLILIAGVIIIFSSLKPNRTARISTIGNPVPEFELIDLDKNAINISELKGSVVLINFWATWCQSCIDELPSLERLYRILSPNPHFKIITVLYKDEGPRAIDFMKSQGYTFPVYLNPDEFVLAHTLETFNIPDHLAAQFALKSSVARAGLEHLLAGFIDPGFNNSVLTLELKNARRMERFPLWPGMRIGQIIFYTMDQVPLSSYSETGRYNGDASVAACKGLL